MTHTHARAHKMMIYFRCKKEKLHAKRVLFRHSCLDFRLQFMCTIIRNLFNMAVVVVLHSFCSQFQFQPRFIISCDGFLFFSVLFGSFCSWHRQHGLCCTLNVRKNSISSLMNSGNGGGNGISIVQCTDIYEILERYETNVDKDKAHNIWK